MTLFPELRGELVGAMERGPRRRRPPVAAMALPAVALLVFLAVLGWPSGGKQERPQPVVVGSERVADLPPALRKPLTDPATAVRPGSPLSVVRLDDPGGLSWTAVAYVSGSDVVTRTAAPDELRGPGVYTSGRGGFTTAQNLQLGPLTDAAVDVVRAGGKVHYLVSGTIAADARAVEIELGGESRAARLAAVPVTVSVPHDVPGQSAEFQRRLARLPRSVSVRAFAAAFTPDLLKGDRAARPKFEVVLADGSIRQITGTRYCVDRRCGAFIPHIGG